jgi:hypothetical protein
VCLTVHSELNVVGCEHNTINKHSWIGLDMVLQVMTDLTSVFVLYNCKFPSYYSKITSSLCHVLVFQLVVILLNSRVRTM